MKAKQEIGLLQRERGALVIMKRQNCVTVFLCLRSFG